MKRPDFIIGGATRSGIHALMQILGSHPQIFIPEKKEHRFFYKDNIFKGTMETCLPEFEDATNMQYKTEIPKSRILHGEQEFDQDRAFETCPNAKIIFTLRNPVDRAYLQYQQAVFHKREKIKPFEKAIDEELSGKRIPEKSNLCWIYKNQYQIHLEDWLSLYPREKLLVMIYEEWYDDINDRGLYPLERFLGLKRDSLSLHSSTNDPINEYPPMSLKMREQLEDIFAVDKAYIRNLVGRKIEGW